MPQDHPPSPAPGGGLASVGGRVARASLVITAIILLCKAMGGVEKFLLFLIYKKDSAERFQMDLYLALAVLAVLFYDIMRYSIIPALMPVLERVRERSGEAGAARLAGSFLNLLALAAVPVLVLAALFPRALIGLFVHREVAAAGAGAAELAAIQETYARETALGSSLLRLMLPAGFFLVTGGVAYCLLQSRRRFAASALGDLAYKVFALLPLVALAAMVKTGGGRWQPWAIEKGIYYVAAGVSLGALGLLLIQLLALRADRSSYHLRIEHRDPAFREVWRAAAWPLLYAVLFLGARRVLDIYFGFSFNYRFHDRGYYTGLELSYRLIEFPFRFLVEPLGYAMFPFLVAQWAGGDRPGFARTLDGSLRTMALILLPVSAVVAVLHAPIADFLAALTKNPQAVDFIRLPLTFYGLAVFGFGMELLLTRAVFAMGEKRAPALLELGALAVYLAVILSCRDTGLRHGAVALGFAVSRTAKALAMAAVLAWRNSDLNLRAWGPFLARAGLLACGAASAAMYGLARALHGPGGALHGALVRPFLGILEKKLPKLAPTAGAALELGLAAAGGLAVYVGLLWLLRVKELRELPAMLRRRRGPAAA